MAKARRKPVPRCRVCGRALRSPDSIARGMGPTCERRVIGVVSRIRPKRPREREGCEYEPIGLLDLEEEDGD